MESKRITERFVKNLLYVMPNWHSKLVRPFRETLNKEMTLETYYCLETLRACGEVTMTELARQLKVPKQQVTKLVDTLSQYDFVERICHKDDRRAVWIRLTPEAVTYLDAYYLKNKDFIQVLETKLTEEELLRLNDAVETLRTILPKLQ